jgi:hypothetical protein
LDHHHIRILNDETSSTTVIPGALPLPLIETLLGNGSFDSGNPAPWSTLLSHEDSPLAIGLKAAWTDIQSHLNDTVINTPQLAILQRPIEAAGMDTDGSFPHSVTAAISKCLDFLAYEQLPQLNHSVQEHLAILNCKQDKYCRQFLGALPNPTGYIEDALFPKIFTQYLGLPSPSCEPLAGGYIGKHPQYVDIYGNSIASSNTVPGGGFTVAHDNNKNTLNDILNTAGLRTIKEAANIFHGKVSATNHDAYLENFICNSDSNRRSCSKLPRITR